MYVGELLPVVVLHDEIRFAFLDRPGRREAALAGILMRDSIFTTDVLRWLRT